MSSEEQIRAHLEAAARLWFRSHPAEHRGERANYSTAQNGFLYEAEAAYFNLWPMAPERRQDDARDVLHGHVVYRAFDQNGDLLYVGMSSNLKLRLRAHKRKSDWWAFQAEITTTVYPTRQEALAAESEAIANESPAWNTAGVRGVKA